MDVHDKTDTYVRHLEYRFQLNNITFKLDTVQCQILNRMREKIKHFTLDEIVKKINSNISEKKARELNQLNQLKNIVRAT